MDNMIEYEIERLEPQDAPVAQLVERYLGKVEVSSSSLVGSLQIIEEVWQFCRTSFFRQENVSNQK